MRGMFKCCFLIFFAISNTDARKYEGSRQVDILLENLEHVEWTDDEQLCKDATFSLLSGVKNKTTWATYIWDSMQHPVAVLYGSRYHLGSFEQCLEDPWSKQPTQYCLVDVKLTESTRDYERMDPDGGIEDYVRHKTKQGNRRLNVYTLGVCLPAVCSSSSVTEISRHIHQLSHLPFGDVSLDPRNCQVKESRLEYSVGFYVFWVIILTTTIITVTAHATEGSLTNKNLIQLANCFSPTKNLEALTKTSQEEVMALNGMRTFCIGYVVIMHYFYSSSLLAVINPLELQKSLKTTLGMILIQSSLFIDVFFVMSGLLHMKGLLTRRSGLLELIWKRYIRLLAPLVLALLFVSSVLPHFVSGPLLPKLLVEQVETCARNWKITSLMINNFVGTHEICPYITWYLSCDLQLTIIGTVIFWCCQKWRRPTVLRFCALLYLASLMIPAVWTYWKELPIILAYDIDEASEIDANRLFQSTYIKPYSRASSYLIGLALGYIIHVYKPKDYRKTISKSLSTIGGFIGLIMIFTVMGLGGALNLRTYNALHASLYAACYLCVFAFGICLVIIAIEYGTFPMVGDFCTSKIFVPLSRLSYGICVYHPLLIWRNMYSIRAPITYDFFHMLVNGFGHIVLTCVFSCLLWFIVEAPVINVTNSLFRNSPIKKSSENGITENSGHRKSTKLL